MVSGGAGQIEHIARTDVAEIGVLAKHIGRHARRGLWVGGIAGAAGAGLLLASEGCDSPSNHTDCIVGVLAVGAVFGAGYGALIGTIVGAVAPRSPDVVYRAP
jgi:hypothetical protein